MKVMIDDDFRDDVTSYFKALYRKYEIIIPAAFFIIGFLYDVFTLGRIDQFFGLSQLLIFLVLIGVFLFYMTVNETRPIIPHPKLSVIWEYREEIVHFMFGTLLSAFTIFFFKSASTLSSFLFIFFLAFLLIANEIPHFQRLGLRIKHALYSLCLLSFLATVIPMLLGFIGVIPFFLAVVTSLASFAGIALGMKKLGLDTKTIKEQFIIPATIVTGSFLLLYLLKLTPPVPLSVQYMGVYHNIVVKDGKYIGYHERSPIRFWENGDQTFYARPGDKIYFFVRLFSPTAFKDTVYFQWSRKNSKGAWEKTDQIPVTITGGREEGFRGFAYKANYQPGKWYVSLITTDGREIGGLKINIISSDAGFARNFKSDVF